MIHEATFDSSHHKEAKIKKHTTTSEALEIIKKILITFDAFIYWYSGYWYIERYDDIFNATTQTYVEYVNGTSYSPNDNGTAVSTSDTPVNFAGLSPMGQAG